MARRRTFAILSSGAAIAAMTFAATFGLVTSRPRDGMLWDLGGFLVSAYSANRGADPYGDALIPAYLGEHHVSFTSSNLTPPISVIAFQPLAELEPRLVFRAWWILSLAAHLACLWSLARGGFHDAYLRPLWAIAFTGLWSTLALGQIYAMLAVPVVVAYHMMARRPVVAGMCIGTVAAWKPNLLLWPLFLLLNGERAIAGTALLTFAATWAAPAVLLGPAVYPAWAATLAREVDRSIATNASVSAWLATFLPETAVWIASAVALASAAALVRRRHVSPLLASDIALTLGLVIAPIAWVGYTMLLLPVFLRRRWSATVAASAALLLVPANVVWRWSSLHPDEILGSRMLYPTSLVLLAVGLLLEWNARGDDAAGGWPHADEARLQPSTCAARGIG